MKKSAVEELKTRWTEAAHEALEAARVAQDETDKAALMERGSTLLSCAVALGKANAEE